MKSSVLEVRYNCQCRPGIHVPFAPDGYRPVTYAPPMSGETPTYIAGAKYWCHSKGKWEQYEPFGMIEAGAYSPTRTKDYVIVPVGSSYQNREYAISDEPSLAEIQEALRTGKHSATIKRWLTKP